MTEKGWHRLDGIQYNLDLQHRLRRRISAPHALHPVWMKGNFLPDALARDAGAPGRVQ
jgi:hypothetical protein